MGEKVPTFDQMVKSFLGFLVGTKKAKLTVSSYKGDLALLKKYFQAKKLNFNKLGPNSLQSYDQFMIKQGLKTNTRRRKILVAKALFRYAVRRKKLNISPAQFIKPPARREVLPWIPTRQEVGTLIEAVPHKTELGQRNKIIFKLLAHTGVTLSELCSLRWEDFENGKIEVKGKRLRTITLTNELAGELKEWKAHTKGKFIFPGFYRHGLFTEKMTPRGVELSMHGLANQLGYPKFKPKSLRHFAILSWLHEGIAETEILRRLGVRKHYPLAQYQKYLEKLNEARAS